MTVIFSHTLIKVAQGMERRSDPFRRGMILRVFISNGMPPALNLSSLLVTSFQKDLATPWNHLGIQRLKVAALPDHAFVERGKLILFELLS